MEIFEIESRMRDAVNNIEKVGREYADAKALSWLLQEQRKVVLASQMAKSEAKSVIGREQDALQSESYKLHLEGTKEAIAEEHRLKATYERWFAQYESCRSMMSLTKKQMEMT